jgi:hypothetical protein
VSRQSNFTIIPQIFATSNADNADFAWISKLIKLSKKQNLEFFYIIPENDLNWLTASRQINP